LSIFSVYGDFPWKWVAAMVRGLGIARCIA
jgi:hypothetical protein